MSNYNWYLTTLYENQETLKNHIGKFHASIQSHIANLKNYLTVQSTIGQMSFVCHNLIGFIENNENAISFTKFNKPHNLVT